MNAYWRLARFHKPVGILLLWFPTAWALWLANPTFPPLNLIILLLIGTISMRAAGCIINDMADRQIDLHVERTKQRPLTTGEISLFKAFIFLFVFLCIALIILWQLPIACFYYALVSLVITVFYPFCKRFIQSPQLILGIAFSLGIPIAFVASQTPINSITYYLLTINFLWIVAYDTQYAMADRRDDLRIGVKSTAILFGSYDCLIIGILQGVFHVLWLPLMYYAHLSWIFLLTWFFASFILFFQQKLLASGDEKKYLQAFSSNAWYGLVIWGGLIGDRL